MTTIDEEIRKLVKARAASIQERLDNLEQLQRMEINAKVRMDFL